MYGEEEKTRLNPELIFCPRVVVGVRRSVLVNLLSASVMADLLCVRQPRLGTLKRPLTPDLVSDEESCRPIRKEFRSCRRRIPTSRSKDGSTDTTVDDYDYAFFEYEPVCAFRGFSTPVDRVLTRAPDVLYLATGRRGRSRATCVTTREKNEDVAVEDVELAVRVGPVSDVLELDARAPYRIARFVLESAVATGDLLSRDPDAVSRLVIAFHRDDWRARVLVDALFGSRTPARSRCTAASCGSSTSFLVGVASDPRCTKHALIDATGVDDAPDSERYVLRVYAPFVVTLYASKYLDVLLFGWTTDDDDTYASPSSSARLSQWRETLMVVVRLSRATRVRSDLLSDRRFDSVLDLLDECRARRTRDPPDDYLVEDADNTASFNMRRLLEFLHGLAFYFERTRDVSENR